MYESCSVTWSLGPSERMKIKKPGVGRQKCDKRKQDLNEIKEDKTIFNKKVLTVMS